MEATVGTKLMKIFAQPASVSALLAVAALLWAVVHVKKMRLTTRMLVHMGLMLALATVLHKLKLYQMPQGGSITLGSMVPLLLLSIWYGPVVGCLAGFVYGLLSFIQHPYILHPLQVLLDYPLPYMALGLAGLFPRQLFLAAVAGIGGRLVCHYLSGVVFFASYAPAGVSPYWYSLVFNASYLIPDLVICLVILHILPLKRLERFIGHHSYLH